MPGNCRLVIKVNKHTGSCLQGCKASDAVESLESRTNPTHTGGALSCPTLRVGFFFFFFFNFLLHWVFIAVHGLSLVVAGEGYSSLRCVGFSVRWLLLLQSTGSRHIGFSSCVSRALECRLSSCGARA